MVSSRIGFACSSLYGSVHFHHYDSFTALVIPRKKVGNKIVAGGSHEQEIAPLSTHATSTIPLATRASLRQFERRGRSPCQGPTGVTPTILTTPMANDADMASMTDFEGLVSRYYRALYQFAFSLTCSEAEACDLTQQTFYVWATKGHQLRDASKVKTWLFTTLHHEFLKTRRRQTRFPHYELEQMDHELPTISPSTVDQLDAGTVVEALGRVDELYQAPVALFYLEEHSYK